MNRIVSPAMLLVLLIAVFPAAANDNPRPNVPVQNAAAATLQNDNGQAQSTATADKPRAVSAESIAYLQRLRKNIPFGTKDFDLKGLRAGMGSRREPTIKNVRLIRTKVGNVACEWVLAAGADPDVRLLYLHGGGFVSGSGAYYLPLAAHISAAAKCAVLLPDYRLAPEHQFPAGLEDCVAAHDWIVLNGPTGPSRAKTTFIAGDSAGGSLTLATLLALRDRRRPLPAGGIPLSPTTDLTLASESLKTVIDPIISARTMPLFRDLYLGKTDPRNPLASPVFGDYRGLPPLLIQLGEHEMLRDDSIRVAKKARADGIEVKLEVWPGMFHVFQSHEPLLPEAREAIEHIAQFIRSRQTKPTAVAKDGLWLDSRVSSLPTEKQGPFVRTKDGEVLAIDATSSYISQDEGKTWSDPRPLFSDRQDIRVSNERAMFRTRDGVIIAAFMNLVERHWTWSDQLGDAPGARLPTYVMRSLDDGKTWQDIQKLHEEWSGAVRDMMQTKDDRVIFTAMKMQHAPGRHSVLTYSSTDNGLNWQASNLIDLGGAGHHGGVTEPTLTELPDGRVWMLIRTNWGEFWSAYSHDGGRFWRIIQPSGIPASSAPGMLKRLSSGRLLLVWNRPYPDGSTGWPLQGGDNLWSATPVSNHREELSIAFSKDDGETWTRPAVIAHRHDTPAGGSARWVSYPYVFEISPGQLWITTMQGGLRVRIQESDFTAD